MSMTMEQKVETLKGLPRLNLGCGFRPEKGFINLDMMSAPGVDVVHDILVTPWPFEDSSLGAINAMHILEHIPLVYVQHKGRSVDALVAVMNECWRVLVPGGRLHIEVPTIHEQGAWQDPTHRRWMVENSVYYFARKPEAVPGTPNYEDIQVRRYLKHKSLGGGDYREWSREKQDDFHKEAVQWSFTEAGAPEPWDWQWYHAEYGIDARFDCLQAKYAAVTGFLEWLLQKPWPLVEPA